MTIQQLSKEVGIGVDTLRVWERRYGFPSPGRDSRGRRVYPQSQIDQLRTVKTLQNLGYRPGLIFAMQPEERLQLLADRQQPYLSARTSLQVLVTEATPEQIDSQLRDRFNRLGLQEFIRQVAIPIVNLLDHNWSMNNLSIAREHLVSDRLDQLLREQLAQPLNVPPRARLLFLTLSGERHKLGLLMAASAFHGQGVDCLLMNEELPLSEVPALAEELQVDGVALSFSCHYPERQAKQDLAGLRRELDQEIKLIAGGHAIRKVTSLPNLIICTDLDQVAEIMEKNYPVED